jgi:prefoldin subunit 5
MAESMEFLKKQNEDLMKQNENLDNRLTATEAQSSQKERKHAERHEKERGEKVRQGKRPINPHQKDNESTIQ